MNKENFQLNAQWRSVVGTGQVRRMRRSQNQIPAVIYGAGKEVKSILLSQKELSQALAKEETYSHILTLKFDKEEEQVVIKQVQRHPSRPRILHIDFLRINPDEKFTMAVPIRLLGATIAVGVKDGGIVSQLLTEIEIQCLPRDLPPYIELDISNLGIEESFHLSDLELPGGVELKVAVTADDERNKPVVSIHKPHVRGEEEIAAEAEAPQAKTEEE